MCPENAVVVNMQGDEPALAPAMLSELVQPFKSHDVNVTTLARKINTKEAENPDLVKVVFAKDYKALYFSRSPMPISRDGKGDELYGHIEFVCISHENFETICYSWSEPS